MEDSRSSSMHTHDHTTVLRPLKGSFAGIPDSSTEGSRVLRRSQAKYYRPWATTSWTLALFLVALAGCLAFIELVRFSESNLTDYVPASRLGSYEASIIASRTHDLSERPRSTTILTTTEGAGSPAITQFTTPSFGRTSSATVTGAPVAFAELSLVHGSSITTSSPANPSTPRVSDPPRAGELKLSATFTNEDYFLAIYLPTLLTVVLQSAWTIIFAATKMVEPFYQLSKSGGAAAQDSLLVDYLSSGLSLDSLQIVFNGHAVLLCASIVQLLMGLVVTLAGESMTVKPTSFCVTSAGTQQPCSPKWYVNDPALTTLEIFMSTVMVLVFAIIFLNRKRKSGVFSDPSSIASMAALLNHASIIEDFRNIPPDATKGDVKRALAGNRYALANFQDSFGNEQYGVVRTVSSAHPNSTRYTAVSNPANRRTPGRSYRTLVLLRDVGFLLVILALFGIILAYRLIHGTQPLNVFLNSNGFGPKFILSATAVLISNAWKRLEREIRVMEPYRRMARQLSPAKHTVLASMTASPFTTVVVAIRRRWYFVSFIAAVTILSELLLIAIPGIPFSTSQIQPAYLASSYTSLAILTVMAVAVVAVLIRRRGDPDMPRAPDTLALVWLYLCGSHIAGTDDTVDESDEKSQTKLYWFGQALGVDGLRRWMVDVDRHGITAGKT